MMELKEYSIQLEIIFILEDDDNSPFKKITSSNDMMGAIEFSIDDISKYENSTISKDYPLRFTYYKISIENITSVNESYLNSKPKARVWVVESLISKIIQNGPDLNLLKKNLRK